MSSVTGRIGEIKQPRGGYIKPSQFEEITFNDDILDKMGLAEHAKKLPKELSGGMRQRVAIARAAAYGGDIIMLDEPFKGIDIKTKAAVFELVKGLIKDKLCIFITHDRLPLVKFVIFLSFYI